jgi:hypothetical protein
VTFGKIFNFGRSQRTQRSQLHVVHQVCHVPSSASFPNSDIPAVLRIYGRDGYVSRILRDERTAHLLIPGVITWGLFFILLTDYLKNEYGFEDREEWIGLQHTRILDDLIDGVYSREAGDGKDMAFGVWAILQRHARFPLPAPDYDQSREEIYTTFSRLLVRIKGTSYLLLLAALKHVEGQPSWVPDWAAGDSHDWRGWGNAEIISRKTQISDYMFPASETARTVSLLHDSRGMGLSIRGRRLDTVIACSTFQPTSLHTMKARDKFTSTTSPFSYVFSLPKPAGKISMSRCATLYARITLCTGSTTPEDTARGDQQPCCLLC